MIKRREADKQLVKRVKDGDKQAYDLLVTRYQNRVLGLIACFVNDYQEVQDVTQEVFIKAYRSLSTFRSDSAFYTWLYRIAINTAKNYLLLRGREIQGTAEDIYELELEGNDEPLCVPDNPDMHIFCDEIEILIHNAILDLPISMRTAFVLREFDGFSYEDIASVMGCPVGTVRSRIYRARELIDQEIKPLIRRND